MKSFFSKITLALSVILILNSCGEPAKPKITIGNEEWAVNRALTYLAKNKKKKKGYDVEIQHQKIEQIYRNLGHGHLDLYMDAWLKGHDVYLFEYPDLVDLGNVYHGCQFGLAVPSYFHIDSISQLKRDSSEYGNTVYGVMKDAGVMISTVQALKVYDLNAQIYNMDEDQLIEKLQMMIVKKENFVTAAWKPHWKIGYFDLKFLKDTSGAYGTVDEIHIVGREGFDTDHPEIVSMLSKIYFNDDLLSSYLLMMKDAKNEEQRIATAREFINQNPDLVSTWLN